MPQFSRDRIFNDCLWNKLISHVEPRLVRRSLSLASWILTLRPLYEVDARTLCVSYIWLLGSAIWDGYEHIFAIYVRYCWRHTSVDWAANDNERHASGKFNLCGHQLRMRCNIEFAAGGLTGEGGWGGVCLLAIRDTKVLCIDRM